MKINTLAVAGALLLATPADRAGAQPPAAPPPAASRSVPDYNRLILDRAYAQQALDRTDAGIALAAGGTEVSALLHAVRAAALATLEREAESKTAIRDMLAGEPTLVDTYMFGWAAAARFRDRGPLVDLIAQAADRVPESERSFLHRHFDVATILSLHRRLRDAGDETNRVRLEEALVAIGWPGPHDPTAGDIFRMMTLDRRLESGDRSAAARIAETVLGPESLTMLVLSRRYDGLTPAWSRPVEAVEEAIVRFDATTARAQAADPRNLRYLLQRVRLLRSLRRESEALALLAPFVAAPQAIYAEQAQGDLILQEAVQDLLALGRTEEAVALSARLVAIDQAGEKLMSPATRHVWVLWQAGRPAQSVAQAERVLRESDADLTGFSRTQVWAGLVCGLTATGRVSEAEPYLRRLRDDDGLALTRALLCANRLDELEGLIVRRLGSHSPIGMLIALQDYRPGGIDAGPSAIVYERLRAMRSRPAVQAALARAGRIVTLPIVRTFPEAF